jgi:hypothetical protein
MSFDTIDQKFRGAKRERCRLECLECGAVEGVEMRSSMTAYHWEGAWDDPANPNALWPGCPSCWERYHDQMQSQWDEYWAGRLCWAIVNES